MSGAHLRSIASAVVLLLLLLPLSDQLPDLRWNLHIWSRMSARGSLAPDTGADVENRSFLAFLPPGAVVGLFLTPKTPPLLTAAQEQTFEFVRYSLAPHRVVVSTDVEFVVESGAASSPDSLANLPGFVLVNAASNDLRLFRRISK